MFYKILTVVVFTLLTTALPPAHAAISPVHPYATTQVGGIVLSSANATRENMHRYVTESAAANDLRGVKNSAYTGKFYDEKLESIRKCIVKRESEGFYKAVNRSNNNYFGAYQMSAALGEGVTWMLADEHKELLGVTAAKDILEQLRKLTPDKWNRYWQDAAFYTIYNWEGRASGAKHWTGGRWGC